MWSNMVLSVWYVTINLTSQESYLNSLVWWPARATIHTNFIFLIQTLYSTYKLYIPHTKNIFLIQTLYWEAIFVFLVQILYSYTNFVFLNTNFASKCKLLILTCKLYTKHWSGRNLGTSLGISRWRMLKVTSEIGSSTIFWALDIQMKLLWSFSSASMILK